MARRFSSGLIWSTAGVVGQQGLGVVASIMIARLLGPGRFGEFGMITNTMGAFGTFAGLGLGMTATKYVAEYRESSPERAGSIIGLTSMLAVGSSVAFMLATVIGAHYFSKHLINAPQLAPDLQIGSVLLLLNVFSGVQSAALAGFEAFKKLAWRNYARGASTLLITVALTAAWGVRGAVIGSVLSALIGCAIVQHGLTQECHTWGVPVRYTGCFAERHILWHFSLPALLAGSLVAPVAWAANAILVNQPNGYLELGLFNAANQWRTPLLFVPGIIGGVMLPMLTSLKNADVARKRRLLFASILTCAACSGPVAAVLILFHRQVMTLYGKGFTSGGTALMLVAITGFLLSIQTPVGTAIASAGKMWVGFSMNLGWALVLLTATLGFVRGGWGGTGLAAAYCIAYLAHCIWTFWFVAYALPKKQVLPNLVQGDADPSNAGV